MKYLIGIAMVILPAVGLFLLAGLVGGSFYGLGLGPVSNLTGLRAASGGRKQGPMVRLFWYRLFMMVLMGLVFAYVGLGRDGYASYVTAFTVVTIPHVLVIFLDREFRFMFESLFGLRVVPPWLK